VIEVRGLDFAIQTRVDEGLNMHKGRRFPIWLTRRAYFKRIARWTKPGKAHKAAPQILETEPAAPASNIVPFPIRVGQAVRPAFPDLRGVSLG
jgi:hypothetical protein